MSYKDSLKNIQADNIKIQIETLMFQNKSLFTFFKGIENGLQSILNDETVKPIILDSILNQLPSQVKQLSEIKFLIHDNQDKIVDDLKVEWERQVKYVQSDISFAELELVKNKLRRILKDNAQFLQNDKNLEHTRVKQQQSIFSTLHWLYNNMRNNQSNASVNKISLKKFPIEIDNLTKEIFETKSIEFKGIIFEGGYNTDFLILDEFEITFIHCMFDKSFLNWLSSSIRSKLNSTVSFNYSKIILEKEWKPEYSSFFSYRPAHYEYVTKKMSLSNLCDLNSNYLGLNNIKCIIA